MLPVNERRLLCGDADEFRVTVVCSQTIDGAVFLAMSRPVARGSLPIKRTGVTDTESKQVGDQVTNHISG